MQNCASLPFFCLAFLVTFNVIKVFPLAPFSVMGELFITKKSVTAKILYKCDTVLNLISARMDC